MQNRTKLIDRLERRFEAIADWSIRHRWHIALMTLLLLSTGGWFAGKVRVDNSLSTFFFKADPAYIAYTRYLDDFVSDEVVYIMYNAPGTEHGPFDLAVMQTIADLTEALEQEVPFLREATSLANVEFVRPSGEDNIEVDELLIEFPETQQELLKSKRLIFSKPFYIDYLVNAEGDYAAIILQMELNSTNSVEETILDPSKSISSSNTYPAASDEKVREILARPEFADRGINYYVSGDVPMNTAYINIMVQDMGKITLLALIVVALLSLIIFRATWVGVFGPITVVLTSVVLTLGLLGLLDWPVGNFFSVLPTLICAVGVAQSVHILLEYQSILSTSGDRNKAIKGALHKVGVPCFDGSSDDRSGNRCDECFKPQDACRVRDLFGIRDHGHILAIHDIAGDFSGRQTRSDERHR